MTAIISTIKKIDSITGGFLPGELILLAGKPGMGKTTLLNKIVLNVAHQAVHNKKVEFVLHFCLGSSELSNIPRFRGIKNVQAAAVIVDDTPSISLEYLVEKYALLKKTHTIPMIAIDYLQLIGIQEASFYDRKQAVIAAVNKLKQLAAEENICILLAADLSHKEDNCPNQTPSLSDLLMVGDLEQLTDMVIFLHRPCHVAETQGMSPMILPGPTTVTIAKNRHGSIGSCELRITDFGKSEMHYWSWDQSNLLQVAAEIKNGTKRATNGSSSAFTIPRYQSSYYRTRYHLRHLFFGSPGEGKPNAAERQSNGYVVNGLRMDDRGFARLNAGLRWPLAEDDPILDHDISECFMAFDESRIPEQYNAICPLDGYVLAINAENYWCLPAGEHFADDGPDSVCRLCPHCLLELASRVLIRRTRPFIGS